MLNLIKNNPMSAGIRWCEDNSTAAGSPAKGTRSFSVDNLSFKNADSTASNYGASPITAGNNSYTKYPFIAITGSFNQILNARFNHISGTVGAGITLIAATTSGYATPSASDASSTLTGILTQTGSLSTGLGVIFSNTGPETASATTLTASGYSCYCPVQLKSTSSAGAGDVGLITWGIIFDEN